MEAGHPPETSSSEHRRRSSSLRTSGVCMLPATAVAKRKSVPQFVEPELERLFWSSSLCLCQCPFLVFQTRPVDDRKKTKFHICIFSPDHSPNTHICTTNYQPD